MNTEIPRRAFLGSCAAALAFRMRQDAADRLGIMCQFDPEETAARKVLAAARLAGFRRAQIHFAWSRASGAFLQGLPAWLASFAVQSNRLRPRWQIVS